MHCFVLNAHYRITVLLTFCIALRPWNSSHNHRISVSRSDSRLCVHGIRLKTIVSQFPGLIPGFVSTEVVLKPSYLSFPVWCPALCPRISSYNHRLYDSRSNFRLCVHRYCLTTTVSQFPGFVSPEIVLQPSYLSFPGSRSDSSRPCGELYVVQPSSHFPGLTIRLTAIIYRARSVSRPEIELGLARDVRGLVALVSSP